jgi:hypothetical protein
VTAIHTDTMNNKLPTVVPFHLFQGFIKEKWSTLEDYVDMTVVDVPKVTDLEHFMFHIPML